MEDQQVAEWDKNVKWLKDCMTDTIWEMDRFLDEVADTLTGKQKVAIGEQLQDITYKMQGACIEMEALRDVDNLYDY